MKWGFFPDMFLSEEPDRHPAEQKLIPEVASEIYSSDGDAQENAETCIDINEENFLFENVPDQEESQQTPDPPSKIPKYRKKKRK